MGEDFRRREEIEVVKRFELAVKERAQTFFDLEEYEEIITYYLHTQKFKKALKACNMGLEQYPYSTEIMISKAQVLSNLEEFDEALALLDSANTLFPGDPEVVFLKATILSLCGRFDEAIAEYERALPIMEEIVKEKIGNRSLWRGSF
jgi:tetratricopeptide (TPR) repeat protein